MTFEDFWILNSNGVKEEVQYTFKFYTEPMSITLVECGIKSLNDLYDCYKDYLRWWNAKYSERDIKYIGKKDELRNIAEFVQQDMFKQKYALPTSSRDFYFFGNMTTKQLKEKHDYFLQTNKL